MKLAEALSIRADLQKKVAQLKERIKESAKVQEGDEPCDNVEELYKELDEVLVQLEDLIYRINITNVQIVQDGDSLTRLIAKRDVLSMRVKALKEVVNYVAANDTRFGRNELKYDRNISEQRDIRYADDRNETDPHWPEDVPCLGRTQKG